MLSTLITILLSYWEISIDKIYPRIMKKGMG